jgi:hypothetical protein
VRSPGGRQAGAEVWLLRRRSSLMLQEDTQTYIKERTSAMWGNTRARKVYNSKAAGLNLLNLTSRTWEEK